MKTVFSKIKEARDLLNLSQEAFAMAAGINRSDVGKIENGEKKFIDTAVVQFLRGKGFDINSLFDDNFKLTYIKEGNQVNEPASSIIKLPAGSNKGIPLVGIEAFAGKGSSDFTIEQKDIKALYVVPDFTNIQFMMRVTGNSMYPKYNSGDVIACRVIHERNFIQWNKVHVIATKTQGILCKRLKKCDTKDHYLVVSDNKDYDPFEIPAKEVVSLALVVGVIRLV